MVACGFPTASSILPNAASSSERHGDNRGECVKVIARARPSNEYEIPENEKDGCFEAVTEKMCTLQVPGKSEPYKFAFDNVFGQHSRQIEVFDAVGVPVMNNVLTGFNSTVLAYGQTGAGKTHTMLGDQSSAEMRGLAPRMLEFLFSKIAEDQRQMSPAPEYKVKCSCLEIYNETITDLLTPGSTNLQLRKRTKAGSRTSVDGLKEVETKSTKHAMKLMKFGTKARRVAATNANETSSRSHLVFSCVVTRKRVGSDGSVATRVSRLNLVDLAGSESVRVSDTKDVKTLKENRNINQSLTCLGRVLKALVQLQRKGDKKVHIPYRDSKLTALLQESLGGNAQTTIIANVSPMHSASWESLSTLQFVQRAKLVRTKARAAKEAMLDASALQAEVLKLRSQLEKAKRNDFPEAGTESSNPESPSVQYTSDGAKSAHCGGTPQLSDIVVGGDATQVEDSQVEVGICVLRKAKEEMQQGADEMKRRVDDLRQTPPQLEEATKAELAGSCVAEFRENSRELADKLNELENDNAALEKNLSESKITVQKLEKENRDLLSRIELVESQRYQLAEKLAFIVNQNEKEKEKASAMKSDFHYAIMDFQEKLQNKDDEMRMLQTALEARIKARDVKLAESSKHFDEEKQQLEEAYREKVARLVAEVREATKSTREEFQHYEEVATRQMSALEDEIAQCKAIIDHRDSIITYLKEKREDLVQTAEKNLREAETSRSEAKELKAELEAVIRASEVQMNALEQSMEQSTTQLKNDIISRDQRIASLQQQLRERDERDKHSEESTLHLDRNDQPNMALFTAFPIGDSSPRTSRNFRPSSAASFYDALEVNDRHLHDVRAMLPNTSNQKPSPARFQKRSDSAYRSADCRRHF